MKSISNKLKNRKFTQEQLRSIVILGATALSIATAAILYPYSIHKKTQELRKQRFASYDSLTPDGRIDLDEYFQGNKYSQKSTAELTREFIAMDNKKKADGYVTLEEFK